MITRSLLSLVPLVTFTSLACADDSITLKNGNSLSGKLINSDTSGILALDYSEANEPIKIKESAVDRIIFDTTNSKNSTLTESIELLNGDHFPCTIKELNNENVSFESSSLGTHTISRNAVSQIKFNTKANKTLYSGPGNDLSAWITTSEDWKLNKGKLHISKRSEASKLIPNLPDNYILEFKTAWEEASPHFQVCFSSDNSQADKKSDFYRIDLNSHGLSLTRSTLGRYETFAQVLSNDNIYGQSNLHVAIHVDRKHQKMALYLNGKLAKTITDPKTPPKGSYIVIKNLQRVGVLTEVSDIKISSWGGKVTENIDSKEDTLTKHDLITDLSGNVMTGQILNLSRQGTKANLIFKAPFAKSDSTIPGSAIDLLEFKTTENAPDLGNPTYHLNLVSGGLISFSSSQMTSGKLIVNHPVLGEITLPKANLSSVVSIPEPLKADAPDEEEED
ncbi:MAG: hypothetical protein ACSHX6_09665 [Akkermansiaceae bacterium]